VSSPRTYGVPRCVCGRAAGARLAQALLCCGALRRRRVVVALSLWALVKRSMFKRGVRAGRLLSVTAVCARLRLRRAGRAQGPQAQAGWPRRQAQAPQG
jgi:hypothetical protein